MTVEPRRPRLVQTSGHTYEWVWPSDPANLAEDERIAEVYHQERMRERAEYAKRREEYLKQVEAERRARELALCLNCHEPVFNGSLYCSRTCEYEARGKRIDMIAAGDTTTECPVCGREVRQSKASPNPRVYCSSSCKGRAKRRRRAGQPI